MGWFGLMIAGMFPGGVTSGSIAGAWTFLARFARVAFFGWGLGGLGLGSMGGRATAWLDPSMILCFGLVCSWSR